MRLALSMVLASALSGCGSSKGSDSSGGSSGPFAGTFSGTETGTQKGVAFSQSVSFTLAQSGSAVTGTWTSQSGGSGSVSGAAVDAMVSNLQLSETDSICPGTFVGSMSISGAQLTATFSGSPSNCGAVSATVTATKK